MKSILWVVAILAVADTAMAQEARIRPITPGDLIGSWGDVSETGEALANPYKWACPGWPAASARVQRGAPKATKLPKGGEASLAGAFGFARDKDGSKFWAHRTLIGDFETPAVQPSPPIVNRSPVSGDFAVGNTGTFYFKLGEVEHSLKRTRPLKWTYASDGKRVDVDYAKEIGPEFFVFEHSYKDAQGQAVTEYAVKCL